LFQAAAFAASVRHDTVASATRVGRGAGNEMEKALAFAVTLAGVGLMAVSVALFGVHPPSLPSADAGVWAEAKWPFLLDQWGTGKAFACADCGAKVRVYVRPKIGFCNCTTGVSDDAELERVADTDLVSPNTRPSGPSQPVTIGAMKGLARAYGVSDGETGEILLSVAYNNDCDVVVAVATLGNGDPATVTPKLVAFLGSEPMLHWARKELGLE
jgi:hypothetical protein